VFDFPEPEDVHQELHSRLKRAFEDEINSEFDIGIVAIGEY
jgi:hypothetical protein